MTDDVLAPWIAAYREENLGTTLDTVAIRRRVLLGVGARKRRGFRAARFVLPVAATFFGSVALAASQGALPRLDEVREWLGIGVREDEGRTTAKARARGGATARTAPSTPVVVEPSRPAAEKLSLDELPLEKPVSKPKAQRSSSDALPNEAPATTDARREATPEVRNGSLGADLRAYQEAHRLHFDGGDPGQALAAWDTYLAAHPAGTFAPEARLNRAVCLLRLGRRAEARSVLVPLAEGSSFAFGRDRARALLDAMGE